MEKDVTGSYTPADVTHRMIVTNQRHRRMLEKNLDGTGVHRAQHRILMTIACGEFHSQAELAKRLEVTPATVAVALKSMEKENLICRRARKSDNRINFVELTEKGRAIVEESQEFFDSVNEEMYCGFTEQERRELSGYLDRICRNMERMALNEKKWKTVSGQIGGENETV